MTATTPRPERSSGDDARTPDPRDGTGVPGLDQILGGGLPRSRLFLLEGEPGAGKTTFALKFLMEGVRLGQPVLYITLSESDEELRAVIASHGWTPDGIDIFELGNDPEVAAEQEQTILNPSEIELGETIRAVTDRVDAVNPTRVVLDSLSEMRLLAQDPLRYRRQILALKRYFSRRRCTVLLLDDKTADPGDLQLHSVAHGVIGLLRSTEQYGTERRSLRIMKMRGVRFRGGAHDVVIDTGRVELFPRLVAAEHAGAEVSQPVSSGVAALDEMLGGGMMPGTNTMLLGPAGVGKTTTACLVAWAALGRGETVDYYLFDEGVSTLLARSRSLGMDLRPHVASGRLLIHHVDPAELSPGEFAQRVVDGVERGGARTVVIDSMTAYLLAMPGHAFLMLHMHELLSFLNQSGVVTVLIVGQHGLVGDLHSEVDLSYLSDAVLLYRYFESNAQIRVAVTAVKSRTTQHQRSIRELRLSADRGVQIGDELSGFEGVFTGVTAYRGGTPMLDTDST